MRKGLLSRWLLPFDDDTNCNDQSERHMVHGKTLKIKEHIPEIHLPENMDMCQDLEDNKDDLIKLRATIRIKIADDNDLNQAKTVCRDVMKFFYELQSFCKKSNLEMNEAIKDVFAL